MPKVMIETRHFGVTRHLRERLMLVPAGTVVPTMRELQSELNISQVTLARALNKLKREGLICRPSGKQRMIVAKLNDPAVIRVAIICPNYISASFGGIASAAIEACRKANWSAELKFYQPGGDIDFNLLIGENDCAVFIPSAGQIPSHIRKIVENPHKPIVLVQESIEGINADSVCFDNFKIGTLAAKHLLDLGHSRVLAVLDQPHVASALDRIAGWQAEMQAANIENIDDRVIDCNVTSNDDARLKTYNYFSKWMDGPHIDFTAIFCASDVGAMAVLRALSERHINVPDEVSIVAHGGEANNAAFLNPPLTAIENDISEYGNAIVSVLNERLTGKEKLENRQILLSPYVVRRRSTKQLVK